MPTLAMIHTVNWYDKSVIEPFARDWLRRNPDVSAINIMDDSLLTESLAHGGPTPAVTKRMVAYILAAEAAGADVIMCSCTTMGKATEVGKALASVPVFNIDEPMAREAVRAGRRLGIVATVPTSAPATRRLLMRAAQEADRDVEIETVVNEPAFQALLDGRLETHDRLVHEEMDRLAGRVDAIVLGQISLAKICHDPGAPVYQVGHSGFAEARRLLDLGNGRNHQKQAAHRSQALDVMAEERAKSRQRYVLIFLLFLHTVNTYMDRVCISAAGNSIQEDLGISDQMMGYVFGIFAIGYALFQIPAGWFADRFGARRALAWVVIVWSTFTALTGAAWNAASMLVIRFLFGAGEAGRAFPGATRAFYGWLPARERGFAQGIFHSGARFGAAASLFLMPLLIHWIGWRWTFVANGVAGVVWGLAWLWWFRDDPAEHRFVSRAELEHIRRGMEAESAPSPRISFIQIVTSVNMLLAMFQYIASNVTFFISFTWLLPYLDRRWGEDAVLLAPVPLIFGMLAQWTAAAVITWLYARGFPVASRRVPAMAGFLIGALGLLLCTVVPAGSALAFVLCFSVAVFGVEMTISPSWAFCMDVGGARSGAVSGAMNMLGNLGAAMTAMLFPWFVRHVTLPVLAPTTGTADSFFAFAAALNLAAAAAWLLMNPKRKLGDDFSPRRALARTLLFAALVALVVAALLYTQFFL